MEITMRTEEEILQMVAVMLKECNSQDGIDSLEIAIAALLWAAGIKPDIESAIVLTREMISQASAAKDSQFIKIRLKA